jgi:hypothetical protein
MRRKVISILLLLILGCAKEKQSIQSGGNMRKPITSIEEARRVVSKEFKETKETLWISDSLNDSIGINMAIVLDRVLKAGYVPDGFEQKDGYRIYKYRKD